jgi:hypothetical protein
LEDLDRRNVVESILERLRGEELPTQRPKPRKRRKRDIRTIRRIKRGKQQSLSKEEKADRARSENGTLRGQYHKLRREIKRRALGTVPYRDGCNWEWNLTLAEWLEIWLSCPMVEVGLNYKVPAWKARGRDNRKDVQIKRLDPEQPFTLKNMMVVRGSTVLYPIR